MCQKKFNLHKIYTFFILIFILQGSLLAIPRDIRDYLPATWGANDDLKIHIQNALDNEDEIRFPGSSDPYNPLVYPSTAGLVVRENCIVWIEAAAELKRLPSEGTFIRLNTGSELSSSAWGPWRGVINGNKNAHWPQFQDLGKTDYAVFIEGDNVKVAKIKVYDNPGIAFGVWGDNCTIEECDAENVGYIDVKFGADYYQGAWDQWSADGFYIRGEKNLIKNCTAVDCFRWDVTTPHEGPGDNLIIDFSGKDVNWATYGFIDIETAEPNNTYTRCDNLGGTGNYVAVTTEDSHIVNCDIGESYMSFYANFPDCTISDSSMTYLKFMYRSDPFYQGTYLQTGNSLTFTGQCTIDTNIEIENGGFALIQDSGQIDIGGKITDIGNHYPEDGTSYEIIQNDGTINISGGMVLGERNAIEGIHELSGGVLNMAGDGSDAKLVYGFSGGGYCHIINGSTITENSGAGIPVTVRWNSGAYGQIDGYGVIGTTGAFVNNGKVIADGKGLDRDLDFTSVSSVNQDFSANGTGNDGTPQDIANATDNGWYAINRGRLVLPPASVSAGSVAVNWGERSTDGNIDLVNSARVDFTGATLGDLSIALLAADREEAWPGAFTCVWDVDFSGSFNSANLTFRYDVNYVTNLGINEADLKVYQWVGGTYPYWNDVTNNVDMTNKHITTNEVTSFSYFAVGVLPAECNDMIWPIYSDTNGPDGVPDCYVNMYDYADFASKWLDIALPDFKDLSDLAVFASEWLFCSDPTNLDCDL